MDGRVNGQWPVANGQCLRSANGLEPYASLTFPFLSCSAILPSHATLLTINRTRTAGPLDCVIPRSSRVPLLNHRGPSSCRPMQGSASSRPFSLISFRLTDFLHGSLPRPGLSAALLLGPSSSVPIPSPPSGLSQWTGLHGLSYRHSTILLSQARLFLVSGDSYCAPSDP